MGAREGSAVLMERETEQLIELVYRGHRRRRERQPLLSGDEEGKAASEGW